MEKNLTVLMTELKNGNMKAMDELYNELTRKVNYVALGISENDKEDFLQMWALEIWRCKDKFDENRGDFMAWVKLIGRRLYIKYIEKKKRQPQMVSMYQQADDEELCVIDNYCSTPSAEFVACKEETQKNVWRSVGILPEQYQKALKLKYIIGKKSAEIAAELDCEIKAVSNYLARGRQKLREDKEMQAAWEEYEAYEYDEDLCM